MGIKEYHERLGYHILGIKVADYLEGEFNPEAEKYKMVFEVNKKNRTEDDGVKDVERIKSLATAVAKNLFLNPLIDEIKKGTKTTKVGVNFTSRFPKFETKSYAWWPNNNLSSPQKK